jgi:hypothetical protein
MAKKIPTPRKRRTREHIIADLSVNYVERQVLLCGYTMERIIHDYGMDLILFTYNDNGEVEVGEIFFQLKATEKLKILADGKTFAFRIESADLRYWLRHPMPVILVVYDAIKDKAYWLYVQAYCRKHGIGTNTTKKDVTFQLSLANRLTPKAVKKMSDFKIKISNKIENLIHED